jgi:lysophospholipid acyltransferase (LPLAT)-like uncharacterized protein
MDGVIRRAAYRWGRWIAAYGQYVVKSTDIQWYGLENIPNEPTIWFCWHGMNLLAIALHHKISPRPVQAFVPPGLVGTTMTGWLEGSGFEPVLLPQDGTGNPSAALKTMLRGLSKNGDVAIAVDGPHGPAGWVRPGTFWLGRITERSLIAVAFAAHPAVRFPRWDRHLIPFPGARLVGVIGKPFCVNREQEIDRLFLDAIREMLNSTSRLAWEILGNKKSFSS